MYWIQSSAGTLVDSRALRLLPKSAVVASRIWTDKDISHLLAGNIKSGGTCHHHEEFNRRLQITQTTPQRKQRQRRATPIMSCGPMILPSAASQAAVNQLVLICFSAVYLFAFSSLYIQIPGLYGNDGILPVSGLLQRALSESQSTHSFAGRFAVLETLVWLFDPLGITPSQCMELLCLLGASLALCSIVWHRFRIRVVFAVMWLSYFSVYQVGQTFLHFQWDILLLEAGALGVLTAPTWYWTVQVQHKENVQSVTTCDHNEGLGLMMIRWLFFRLMYLAGIVKLTSQCPTWWGLTAMDYHYETQCLPTALAWYAHQLPKWFQALSVVGVFIIEIGLPFLFFLPMRRVRWAAGLAQVALMTMIFASGNYNFFNIMTAILFLSLLTDQDLQGWVPAAFLRKHHDSHATSLVQDIPRRADQVALVVAVLSAFACMHIHFGVQPRTEGGLALGSAVQFSRQDYATFVTYSMQVGMAMGCLAVAYAAAMTLRAASKSGSLFRLLSAVASILVAGVLLAASFEALRWNDDNSTLQQQPLWTYASQAQAALGRYSVVNSYGLFRRMTGVGGRPELTVEASQDGDAWDEYLFKFKPNRPQDAPLLIAPHQPRLDWQMWFAALGSIKHNTWLQSLAVRLLQGKQDVLDLLAADQNSRIQVPPQYVRIRSWKYHFTTNSSKDWWQRTVDDGLYLNPISLKTHQQAVTGLLNYLSGAETQAAHLFKDVDCTNQWLCSFLSTVRRAVQGVNDQVFVATMVVVTAAIAGLGVWN
eukprot:m.163167 g.163167  ORF g.163167 m.163167 type:complete len:762 (+) comp16546_c0_seq19:1160-3445(+)